jgi:hypothetical protein
MISEGRVMVVISSSSEFIAPTKQAACKSERLY